MNCMHVWIMAVLHHHYIWRKTKKIKLKREWENDNVCDWEPNDDRTQGTQHNRTFMTVKLEMGKATSFFKHSLRLKDCFVCFIRHLCMTGNL